MCLQCKSCLLNAVLASFLIVLTTVTSFNIDSVNYAIYQGSDSSMFGFSLAVHKEGNNGWLIVGAPEGQSHYQRRVIRGGVVYKCPTDRDDPCQEIPFDTKDDNYKGGEQMDNKTEQWFGATVSTSGRENGPVVACAPRYTWYPRRKTRRDPVGTCYVSNELFNHFNEYSPCRTFQWGYHRQGSCQAGFSAAINHDGDRLFIGSPGSWYWQGQMYSVDAHAEFDFKPEYFSGTYGEAGQVHQQSLETRPAVFSTTEGTEKDDDSYMGYSTIVGDFLGNGEDGIAVGMPRGNDLKGRVLVFTWNLTNFIHHLSSDQLGSYYGYALAASDVDGDGKVDLIIGAPMYTVSNTEGKYDVGRVYVVYHQSDLGKFVAVFEIDGFNSKSRFGQALASLGDINQDGYGDFVVGAPYDGPDERGAVYIYHGSKNGARKKYSQVIYAADVIKSPTGALTTFGFSVTGGLDLDGNEYPDMAVGAYMSSNAFFFRSRPVVKVHAAVNFLALRDEVDITKPNYILKSGGKGTTTQIQFCLKYHGKGIPDYIDLHLQYILDTRRPKTPRMGFVEAEPLNVLNDTIRIYKDRNDTCKQKEVYVKSDIRDKLTPLEAEMKYWLKEESASYYQVTRNPRSILKPILDLNSPPSRKDSISVHKECGDDGICYPNLNINVTSNVNEYLLGSDDPLLFDVVVSNYGEDSYETTLDIEFPNNAFYMKAVDVKVQSPVLCNTYGNHTLHCDIGNPIPKDKVVWFQITWQLTYIEDMLPTYNFLLRVNSTNQEHEYDRADNVLRKEVKVKGNFHLEITGVSQPQEAYVVNSSHYTVDISKQTMNTEFENRLSEESIGPQVAHIYYLHNKGPTPIKETEVFFIWPSHTLEGGDLLYLLEKPHFSPSKANVECSTVQANYRGFNILLNEASFWKKMGIQTGAESSVSGSKITAIVGGGVAKHDKKLDAAVDASSDSSGAYGHRHESSQSAGMINKNVHGETIHTSSQTGQFINGFIENTETHSKMYTNSSGTFVTSSSGTVSKVADSKDFSHIGGTFRCYELVDENLSEIPCETGIKYRYYRRTEGSTKDGLLVLNCFYTHNGGRYTAPCATELLNNGLSYTFNQYLTVTQMQKKVDYSQRCYSIMNGETMEVDCGPGFTIKGTTYRCFDQINGKLVKINCESGYRYHYYQESPGALNLIRGCFNQRREKITCGPEVLKRDFLYNFREEVSTTLDFTQGGNASIQCYERVNGFVNPITCRSGITYKYDRTRSQGGYDLMLGCFDEVNGVRTENNCGAMEGYEQRNIVVNFHQNSGDSGSSQEHIINVQNNCYDIINNVKHKVECRPDHRIDSYSIHPKCFDVIEGRHVEVPCVPGGPIPEIHQDTGVIQIGGDTFTYRCYEVSKNPKSPRKQVPCIGEQYRTGKITYECFKHVHGALRPFQCAPTDIFRDYHTVDTSHASSASTGHHSQGGQTRQFAQGQLSGQTQSSSHSGQGSAYGSQYSWQSGQANGSQFRQGGSHQYQSGQLAGSESGQSNFKYSSQEGGSGGDPRYYAQGGTVHVNQGGSGQSGTAHFSHGGTQGSAVHFNQGSGGHYNREGSNYYSRVQGGHRTGSYSAGEEEEEEESAGKSITSYYKPDGGSSAIGSVSNSEIGHQGRQSGRNPTNYGKNGGSNQEILGQTGIGNAALNRGYTTTMLDLTDIGERSSQGSGQGHSYQQEYHWSQNGPVPHIEDNSAGRDNVPTDKPTGRNRFYGRKKRDIAEGLRIVQGKFPCHSVNCMYMSCKVGLLNANDQITFALRSRLNARLLKNVTTSQPLKLSSVMVARVSKLPYISELTADDSSLHFYEVPTSVAVPVSEVKPDVVPLWVVVLSAVAGTIILLLLIFLLYKLGFFKRNRPSNAPERQPLNRNGYHHGDEAL